MDKCRLGANGPEVSRLCFGTLTIQQKHLTAEDGARLLIHARECGVNFLDTAQFYQNYEPIRLALKACPDYIVCTKSYCYDEATAQQAFDEARRALGREYIDLFLLHEQESIHTLRGHERALEFLARQKERGYIGQTGVSTHFVSCVRSASVFPHVDVIMPLVNMAGVGVPDGTAEDMAAACAEAHARGVALYGMKALGGGSLLARREEALAYALAQPYLASIAVGMQSFDEIDCNVALFEGRPLPAEAAARLRAQPRRLLIDDWCEGCGACVRRCRQNALRIEDGKCRVEHAQCALCGYCAAACPQFCIKII
ncbi:MAG: aldo/keto reductase [Eubacteriales bacterium]|nr:aldo/keto reductase [Eubacteriales bacterium]